ncbi:MAG TPA: hypothetical protein VI248_08950 [Kineosporiaceae bacterium]
MLRLHEVHGVNPPTIQKCKFILDAVFTTALNDRITVLHPGKGALDDEAMHLLVETDIETGLRWGELTELRPRDVDPATRIITVSRVVVHLRAKERPVDERFVVKEGYAKLSLKKWSPIAA